MSNIECENQLQSLIEHFENGGKDFNATDIYALKYLMLKNKQLKDNWNEIKKCIEDEIERTNKIIEEDCNMVQMNNLRKMINNDRKVWLYKMQELEEGENNDC